MKRTGWTRHLVARHSHLTHLGFYTPFCRSGRRELPRALFFPGAYRLRFCKPHNRIKKAKIGTETDNVITTPSMNEAQRGKDHRMRERTHLSVRHPDILQCTVKPERLCPTYRSPRALLTIFSDNDRGSIAPCDLPRAPRHGSRQSEEQKYGKVSNHRFTSGTVHQARSKKPRRRLIEGVRWNITPDMPK